MDEAEGLARVTRLREEAMAVAQDENERMAREAARDCCEQCPYPKSQRDQKITLPNGVRLSLYVDHCQNPGPDCTALVQAHLPSESPAVANRVIEYLAAVPELAASGVSWLACLAPDADRLILTYRVPASEQVATAVGALQMETFRQ